VTSIAFPAISCGVYGFPIPRAAEIAIRTITGFLPDYPGLQSVIIAAFGDDVEAAFGAALRSRC
jgi:O-acetyl-ADP-ribose deacetylase